jgi:hypothetical protein
MTELQCLVDLGAAGWRWLPPVHDDEGELFEIRGVRTWPGGWADALRLRDSTDAKAVRCTPLGTVMWSREGTMQDVVDGLLGLPAPSTAW